MKNNMLSMVKNTLEVQNGGLSKSKNCDTSSKEYPSCIIFYFTCSGWIPILNIFINFLKSSGGSVGY